MDQLPVHAIIIASNRLRDWRRERAVTQEELAGAVGVSRQSIIAVETGRCLPSVPLAIAIARFFDSPVEELFVLDDQSQKNREVSMNRELGPFRGMFDRMWEESMLPSRRAFDSGMVPQMNIYQTEKELVVEADVPGMSENDVDIEIRDGVLTIKGERKEQSEQKDHEYFHREVSYGAFQRAVTLPTDVIPEKATAEVKKGQLRVVFPKVEPEQPKVHKVKAKGE